MPAMTRARWSATVTAMPNSWCRPTRKDETPFICSEIPQFVEVRGGDYFFLPSMTALRMIGMGIVDPT